MTEAPKYHFPVSAERSLVPELEKHAHNQMPKDTGWTGLHLVRYNGTNLYQWYGRKEMPRPYSGRFQAKEYSAFIDPCDEPFIILPIEPPEVATVVAEKQVGWIVGNGSKTQWRTWDEFGRSTWTPARDKATRYARREDAETVHREDEDAWCIVPYEFDAVADKRDRDAALAIGEHAFRAGHKAGWGAAKANCIYPEEEEEQTAWNEYDPPENIKALA